MVGAVPRRIYALAARDLGQPPAEWILLLPAGDAVLLRDGRAYGSAGAEAVVAEWRRQKLDLPVDLNHAEMWRAPYGGDSPAYGWVTAMEVRNGGEVWGRVEWTDEGRRMVESRRYRYYSPTFSLTETAGGSYEIGGITSVALVNRPALPDVEALAREDNRSMGDRIRAALGLADEATEQQVLDAIAQRSPAAGNAPAAGNGPPAGAAPAAAAPAAPAAAEPAAAEPAERRTTTVPLADYQLVAARARTAEEALQARDEADLKTAAAAAVDAAIEGRKIAPASREYHLANCRTRADLDRFKTFAAGAPELIAAGSAAPAGAQNAAGAGEARTPEDIEVGRQMGFDEEAGS